YKQSAAAPARATRWSGARRHFRSLQLPQQRREPVDVTIVLVDSKTDPQNVAANVGDAVPGLELLVPAQCGGASEGEEAGMRKAVDRIEELGLRDRRARDRGEQLALKSIDVRGNALGRELVLGQHPPDRREPVEPGGIEGRAEESRSVLGIANATGRKAQILEFGEPAGDLWARTKTGRRVKKGAPLARHRIFVSATEIESGLRCSPAERPIERHKSVVSIDHRPWSLGPAKLRKLIHPAEETPASEQ